MWRVDNHVTYDRQEQQRGHGSENADNNTGGFEPFILLLINGGEPGVVDFQLMNALLLPLRTVNGLLKPEQLIQRQVKHLAQRGGVVQQGIDLFPGVDIVYRRFRYAGFVDQPLQSVDFTILCLTYSTLKSVTNTAAIPE